MRSKVCRVDEAARAAMMNGADEDNTSEHAPASFVSSRRFAVAVVFVMCLASCGSQVIQSAGDNGRPVLHSELDSPAPRSLELATEDLHRLTEMADGVAAADTAGTADDQVEQVVDADPAAGDAIVVHVLSPVIEVRSLPSLESSTVSTVNHPNAEGRPVVFQALGEATDGWIQVLLPQRPNGLSGWVQLHDVELTRNPYRIDLDVQGFELTISRRGEEVISTTVAIGDGDTPTPIGDFFLVELLRPPDPTGSYGPYAYGLSGFSNSLLSFNGGPGVIGIHGTDRPDLLGTNVSHGCIRVDNTVIEEMVSFLPLGTPVSIR